MDLNYYSMKAPHLVIIGGGFAGLELVKKLRNKPIRVTLLDKNNYFTFQPLLYQIASGGLGSDAVAYPLRKIVSGCKNIIFRMTRVERIDLSAKTVITPIGDFNYDYLCIATGATTNYFGNAELQRLCMPLKSIPDALDLRSDILQQFEKAVSSSDTGEIESTLNFVVVGGGPTGVETAGALAEIKRNVVPADYKELNASHMQVHLVEASPKLLASMSEPSSEGALRFLKELGVEVHLKTAVESYDGDMLRLNNGETLRTKTVVWSAGVKGNGVEGIPAEKTGKASRYKVDVYNRIEGYEEVFAIGDVALMSGDPKYPNGHPMVAPVGMQQAHTLAKNLLAQADNKPFEAFSYFDKGSMATVGRHKAVFESFGIRMQGYLAWLGWMFLHLMLLVGYRNRIIVLVNWMWNYFSYQRAIRIITRPFVPGSRQAGK